MVWKAVRNPPGTLLANSVVFIPTSRVQVLAAFLIALIILRIARIVGSTTVVPNPKIDWSKVDRNPRGHTVTIGGDRRGQFSLYDTSGHRNGMQYRYGRKENPEIKKA
jgi:hypothetical protein